MVGMTLVTIPLMDRAGRRTLHLSGLAGMFLFSIVFTVAFSLNVSIICRLILDEDLLMYLMDVFGSQGCGCLIVKGVFPPL